MSLVDFKYKTKISFDVEQMPISILAIGLSTGGAEALTFILKSLDKSFPWPIVVVQHASAEFAENFARLLDEEIDFSVEAIRGGEFPKPGKVLLAATDNHLVMRKDCSLHYSAHPVDAFCKPSINVFFESLALCENLTGISLLLTGMGDDGAKGMLLLKQKGWHTIVEDESTSTVFGMPKAAIELGATSESVPLHQIPVVLKRLIV